MPTGEFREPEWGAELEDAVFATGIMSVIDLEERTTERIEISGYFTTDHSASSYGLPVFIMGKVPPALVGGFEEGRAYGSGELRGHVFSLPNTPENVEWQQRIANASYNVYLDDS